MVSQPQSIQITKYVITTVGMVRNTVIHCRHIFATKFIYSFAELALVTPKALDSSNHTMTTAPVQALISHLETNKHESQFGVCGLFSFHVVPESTHPSQNSSCS